MVIKNFSNNDILKNKNTNSKFLSIYSENLNFDCKTYKGDFYIDDFNYFPITTDNLSFLDLFSWKEKNQYNYFYSKEFLSSFNKRKNDCDIVNNAYVIGSSPQSNYYRNLLTFLPRVFFIADKEINVAIHRNTPNKLREFIKNILLAKNIKLNKFIYIDNGFTLFKNSQIPQFLNTETAVRILNNLLNEFSNKNKLRIYVTRKNSYFRKLVNEADIIKILKLNNFQIVDPESLKIEEQIRIFSSAEMIIGPTGSGLANIVFCKKGTKLLEIMPGYQYSFENNLKNRYSKISQFLGLEYHSISADPVEIKNLGSLKKSSLKKLVFIDPTILQKSNYYKNLIIKISDLEKFIKKFNNP